MIYIMGKKDHEKRKALKTIRFQGFLGGGGWGIRTLVPVKANGFQVIERQYYIVTVCPRKSLKIPDFCPFSCNFLQIMCKMQEKCKKESKTVRVVISLILTKDMKV